MKKKTKIFKAVLFDMDGVLADSMPYHFISWFEALRKYDVRVTPTDIFEMEGAKWDTVIKFAFERERKPLTDRITTSIYKNREKLFNKHFTRYIFSEAYEILKTLKQKGFLVGLVTGSRIHEAEKILPKNIYKMFDAKVAGNMVKKGKPFPDSYLLAAKMLKVKPSECFVVENAPYGIKAAKAAKMYCAAIATSLPKECLSKADMIFANHKEFLKYIKHIEKSINS